MKRSLIVLVVMVVAGGARADTLISVKATEQQLDDGIAALSEQLEEPIGLVATAPVPALGLVKGDLVRAVDGQRALRGGLGIYDPSGGPVVYLDVRRGGRELVVRVEIQLVPAELHVKRRYFKDELEYERQYSDVAFGQVTRAGRPVGVVMRMPFAATEVPLEVGDVVRRIDGAAVTTPAQLLGALDAAKDHARLVIDAERLDRPVTITVLIDDPSKEEVAIAAGLSKIRKVGDHTYEVPKDVVDALIANPTVATLGARMIPAMRDGKPDGFKLYAIRPDSLFAVLGFMNGDTLQKVNGLDITSADKALEVYTKLRRATALEVELLRRGKPVKLDYRIR